MDDRSNGFDWSRSGCDALHKCTLDLLINDVDRVPRNLRSLSSPSDKVASQKCSIARGEVLIGCRTLLCFLEEAIHRRGAIAEAAH